MADTTTPSQATSGFHVCEGVACGQEKTRGNLLRGSIADVVGVQPMSIGTQHLRCSVPSSRQHLYLLAQGRSAGATPSPAAVNHWAQLPCPWDGITQRLLFYTVSQSFSLGLSPSHPQCSWLDIWHFIASFPVGSHLSLAYWCFLCLSSIQSVPYFRSASGGSNAKMTFLP